MINAYPFGNITTPPIKSQGVKTRLVPWLHSLLPENIQGAWVEPFMGTGSVGFNLAPGTAKMGDLNPHIVMFYSDLKHGKISPESILQHLEQEGSSLAELGGSHYYAVRDRFNTEPNSLDFLWLSRACFNGLMRFNKSGGFNTSFCRNPNRFRPRYINKIMEQVYDVFTLLSRFEFSCQGFEDTLSDLSPQDFVYCDPPYINRNAIYYNNGWSEEDEHRLFGILDKASFRWALSTWDSLETPNKYIKNLWGSKYRIYRKDHEYVVGGSRDRRKAVQEILVTNYA